MAAQWRLDVPPCRATASATEEPDVVGHSLPDGDRGHGVRTGGRHLFLPANQTAVLAPQPPPPALLSGTLNTPICCSAVAEPNREPRPSAWTSARRRLGLASASPSRLLFLSVRVLDSGASTCRWDTDAYGIDRLDAARPAHVPPADRLLWTPRCSTPSSSTGPPQATFCRRQRERALLVLRGCSLAADLCGDLLRAIPPLVRRSRPTPNCWPRTCAIA